MAPLNGDDVAARIPPETRARVQTVIRKPGYAADPIVRRMVSGRNRILLPSNGETLGPVKATLLSASAGATIGAGTKKSNDQFKK